MLSKLLTAKKTLLKCNKGSELLLKELRLFMLELILLMKFVYGLKAVKLFLLLLLFLIKKLFNSLQKKSQFKEILNHCAGINKFIIL